MFPEGMLRFVPAPEYQRDGITPIAVEKMQAGEWKLLGYDGGSRILTLNEWLEVPLPTPAP